MDEWLEYEKDLLQRDGYSEGLKVIKTDDGFSGNSGEQSLSNETREIEDSYELESLKLCEHVADCFDSEDAGNGDAKKSFRGTGRGRGQSRGHGRGFSGSGPSYRRTDEKLASSSEYNRSMAAKKKYNKGPRAGYSSVKSQKHNTINEHNEDSNESDHCSAIRKELKDTDEDTSDEGLEELEQNMNHLMQVSRKWSSKNKELTPSKDGVQKVSPSTTNTALFSKDTLSVEIDSKVLPPDIVLSSSKSHNTNIKHKKNPQNTVKENVKNSKIHKNKLDSSTVHCDTLSVDVDSKALHPENVSSSSKRPNTTIKHKKNSQNVVKENVKNSRTHQNKMDSSEKSHSQTKHSESSKTSFKRDPLIPSVSKEDKARPSDTKSASESDSKTNSNRVKEICVRSGTESFKPEQTTDNQRPTTSLIESRAIDKLVDNVKSVPNKDLTQDMSLDKFEESLDLFGKSAFDQILKKKKKKKV